MDNEIITLLTKFVSWHTIEENVDQKLSCLQWISDEFLQHTDLPITRDAVEGNPYILLTHPNPQLLWFAHIDVVPGNEEQFSLNRKEDKLFGRGTKDMKGSALPFLMAYRDACAEGTIPPISILLTSDEEVAGVTIPQLLDEGVLKAPVAFTPDTGASPHIVVKHKGVVWADLVIEGKGGHGAMPWESDNPLFTLSEALQKLAFAFPPGNDDDWNVTVSPTTVKGSSARNKIPCDVLCGLDIRFPPELCQSPEEALELVSRHLPEGCTLKAYLSGIPLNTDPDHSIVQRIKRIATDVTSNEVPIGREHGCTDARYFGAHYIPEFLNVPVGEGLHGPDEWVSLRSLIDHYALSTELIKELLVESDQKLVEK